MYYGGFASFPGPGIRPLEEMLILLRMHELSCHRTTGQKKLLGRGMDVFAFFSPPHRLFQLHPKACNAHGLFMGKFPMQFCAHGLEASPCTACMTKFAAVIHHEGGVIWMREGIGNQPSKGAC
jgi:hypothetical protein